MSSVFLSDFAPIFKIALLKSVGMILVCYNYYIGKEKTLVFSRNRLVCPGNIPYSGVPENT